MLIAEGPRKSWLAELARRFASDLAATIERNRRRSRATLRILRLRRGQRWREDVTPKREVILAWALSIDRHALAALLVLMHTQTTRLVIAAPTSARLVVLFISFEIERLG